MKFVVALVLGLGLVVLQGFLAWRSGWFTMTQAKEVHGISRGYAFVEHGGMWADVFLVTPIVAWILFRYHIEYFSRPSLIIMGVIAAVIRFVVVPMFAKGGLITPEAHSYGGEMTAAGWIHILFAIAALWAACMFYFGFVQPKPGMDILWISIAFTLWAVLGVMKFSAIWHWDVTALSIVGVEILLIWGITIWNIKLRS